jgi:hypothetical protein
MGNKQMTILKGAGVVLLVVIVFLIGRSSSQKSNIGVTQVPQDISQETAQETSPASVSANPSTLLVGKWQLTSPPSRHPMAFGGVGAEFFGDGSTMNQWYRNGGGPLSTRTWSYSLVDDTHIKVNPIWSPLEMWTIRSISSEQLIIDVEGRNEHLEFKKVEDFK